MGGTGDGPRCGDAAGLLCGSCGTELPPDSRFCNKCGAPVRPAVTSAEYKQVTVLFADVVHSMDIAAAVGAERLREIMAELVNCASSVVQRFGARWTSSPATESWPCSARQQRRRITRSVLAWLPWVFRRRRSGLPRRSKTATVSTSSCAWDLTPVR